MRLVSYEAGRGPRAGVLTADGVCDAGDGGVGALLRAGGVEAAREVRSRPLPLGAGRLGAAAASGVGTAAAARARPAEDRLPRSQLPLARGGGGDRGA